MQRELSDLLEAARSEPPPVGITVDDAVAAGRRLQGRRRATWAGAAAFVAVAAIAVVAVAVPRGDPPRPVTPPAVTIRPGQFGYPADPWAVSLNGFTVGKLTVHTPVQVTPGYQRSCVTRPDLYWPGTDRNGHQIRVPFCLGTITAYRPGVFDPQKFRAAKATTVGGRPGLYLESGLPYEDGKQFYTLSSRLPAAALAWQYGDNAWVVMAQSFVNSLAKADMVAIAAKLTAGAATPVKVATKLSYVPPGYRVVGAGQAANPTDVMVAMDSPSFLRLVQGPESYARLSEPVSADSHLDRPQKQILISIVPRNHVNYRASSSTFCLRADLCYRNVAGTKYQIEVNGTNGNSGVPTSELEKLVNGITVADLDNRSTFFPITSAVPAGHR
jgi:hypothetical protein